MSPERILEILDEYAINQRGPDFAEYGWDSVYDDIKKAAIQIADEHNYHNRELERTLQGLITAWDQHRAGIYGDRNAPAITELLDNARDALSGGGK